MHLVNKLHFLLYWLFLKGVHRRIHIMILLPLSLADDSQSFLVKSLQKNQANVCVRCVFRRHR